MGLPQIRLSYVVAKVIGLGRRALESLSRPAKTERMLAAARLRVDRAMDLRGLRVLITGSTRGIGRALAAGFASRGAVVIVHGRRQEQVRAAVEDIRRRFGGEVFGVAGDLAVEGAGRAVVGQALEYAGHLDIVVNNAAIHPDRKPLWAIAPAEMAQVMRVNLLAPAEVAAAAVASMLERHIEGRIVNISSDAAAGGSAAGIASYGISKIAVEGLSSFLAAEVPSVATATLRPAAVDTDMVKPLFPWDMRRLMLRPESVVPAVLHLATAPAGAIHGKVFEQLQLLRELAGPAMEPAPRAPN